jgi:hypothetical protein
MYANEESKRGKIPHHFVDYSVLGGGGHVIAKPRMVGHISTVEPASHMLHRGMDKSETNWIRPSRCELAFNPGI